MFDLLASILDPDDSEYTDGIPAGRDAGILLQGLYDVLPGTAAFDAGYEKGLADRRQLTDALFSEPPRDCGEAFREPDWGSIPVGFI
jgi:hypothetical protein